MKNILNLPPLKPLAVKSFWLVLCAFAFIFVLLIDRFQFSVIYFLIPTAVIILTAILAVMEKGNFLFRKGYAFWIRGTRTILLPLARFWIVAVVFYTFFLVNHAFTRGGEDIFGKPAVNTMWSHRDREESPLKGDCGVVALEPSQHRMWLSRLIKWGLDSKNFWMLPMVPFLLLLSMIDDEQEESSVSTETYTLY